MIITIYLILFLESSHGFEDFNSRARNFSLDLLNSTESDNVVIACFNIWSVLASAGLWVSGEYQERIANTLNIPKNKTYFLNEYSNLKRNIFDEKSNGVDISSGIFIYTSNECRIFSRFREIMINHFGAVIRTLNFEEPETAAQIADDLIVENGYQIYNIYRPEDFVHTTMIISSVISFKGNWKSEFNVSHTTVQSCNFENDNNNYLVQMMHKRLKLPYSNMESLNANVMELAIGQDDKFCLLLILPYPQTDIKEVYKKLYRVTLKDIFDKLQSDVDEFGLREIDLTLPKVRIETGILLNKPLSDIGLSDVFDSGGGKFLGITRDNIYVSSIDHSCEVFIQEKEVYAYASTPRYNYNVFSTIKAEVPFIFFVMEKPTQTIVFGGLYTKSTYVLNKST